MKLCSILLAAFATASWVPRAHATTLLLVATDPAAFDTGGRDAGQIGMEQGKRPHLAIAVSSARTESVVPEVATWALMAIGFGLAGSGIRARPVRTPSQL